MIQRYLARPNFKIPPKTLPSTARLFPHLKTTSNTTFLSKPKQLNNLIYRKTERYLYIQIDEYNVVYVRISYATTSPVNYKPLCKLKIRSQGNNTKVSISHPLNFHYYPII